MNTVKFRAWDGLRMTYSGISYNNSIGVLEIIPTSKMMQFADLEDRDGESFDWWEGDILNMHERYSDEEFHAVVIVKKDGCFMAECYEDGNPYIMENGEKLIKYIDGLVRYQYVKVGNIYENHEKLTPPQ